MATTREQTQELINIIFDTQFSHVNSEQIVADAIEALLDDSLLESEKVRGQITNASASAEVTINAQNTPVKVDIPTKNGLVQEINTDISTQGRIAITTPIQQNVFITSTLTKAGNTTTQYNIYIAKNGSIIPQSKSTIRSSNTTDKRTAINQIMVESVDGDYFEVFIENTENTMNATIEDFVLIVRS